MLFNFSLDRYSSIIHTRLRLNVCALNYYLFKIGCKPSPECLCGFEVESINHYFLHCPLFAAPILKLLSSAAYIFAHRWHAMTETQLISVFLLDLRKFQKRKMLTFSIMFKVLLKKLLDLPMLNLTIACLNIVYNELNLHNVLIIIGNKLC